MTNKEAQHHIRALLATGDFDYKERQALVLSFRALNVVQGIEDAYMMELLKTPEERGVLLSEARAAAQTYKRSGEPTPQQPCEDCISRQAVLDKLEKPMNWTDSEAEIQEQRDYEEFIDLVKSMPSVIPKESEE